MNPPSFIASYSVDYTTTNSPKTVSVTTNPGDYLVVYGGSEDSSAVLGTPSGNSITFNPQQAIVVSQYSTAYLWTAIDNTGGTWTLSGTQSGGGCWGITCCVFRNSGGFGTSVAANTSGTPSVGITTQSNSAIVVFSTDWTAVNGSSRTWLTVNGITPTNANGLELTYAYVSTHYTAYGAYYSSAGSAGPETVGLSAPTNQKYAIVAQEVYGLSTTIIATAWLKA